MRRYKNVQPILTSPHSERHITRIFISFIVSDRFLFLNASRALDSKRFHAGIGIGIKTKNYTNVNQPRRLSSLSLLSSGPPCGPTVHSSEASGQVDARSCVRAIAENQANKIERELESRPLPLSQLSATCPSDCLAQCWMWWWVFVHRSRSSSRNYIHHGFRVREMHPLAQIRLGPATCVEYARARARELCFPINTFFFFSLSNLKSAIRRWTELLCIKYDREREREKEYWIAI